MASGFSVRDALNRNSKVGTDESPKARFRTKDISIFKMYPNDMNFYSVEQIEELAGDILMYGLKQNLELVYAPCEKGEYRIVAGERRWQALKFLVSNGYREFEIATSKLTVPQDEDEEQIEIIIANTYRDKTIMDMIEEETRLKESLERMKAAGKKIKGYDLQSGRLRDVIASMLHMSKTKIAQMEAVSNNLIPEWKEELKHERLAFSAAYELSGMSSDGQREALGKFMDSGELTHKDIKDMKEAKAAEAEKQQLEGRMNLDDMQQFQEMAESRVSESDTEYGACGVSESDTESGGCIVSESDTESEACDVEASAPEPKEETGENPPDIDKHNVQQDFKGMKVEHFAPVQNAEEQISNCEKSLALMLDELNEHFLNSDLDKMSVTATAIIWKIKTIKKLKGENQ